MKKIILVLVAVSLIGCGTPKPFHPDDYILNLKLERTFVKEHAQKKPLFNEERGTVWEETEKKEGYSGGFTLGHEGDLVIFIILVAVVSITSLKYLEGTHVYVYPEGYPGYKQKISWGDNRVFVPTSLRGKYVRFVVEIEGNYKGRGSLTVLGRQKSIRQK